MVIEYSDHAKQKLSIRKIEQADVQRVIGNPTELFEEIEHGARAAVGTLHGKFLVVVYRTANSDIKVITVYYTRKLEKLVSSNIQRGAWRKIR